jgi:hypothetical protein
MSQPNVLAASWSDGVLAFTGEPRGHELAGRSVRALALDHNGDPHAIVDGRSVCRRSYDGTWRTIATTHVDLACLAAAGTALYLGTDDARLLHLTADGVVVPLEGFDRTPGRDRWYAGTALINGHLVGPPLGIRSMTATSDGRALLANVHVGGIPRSTDGGETWEATIDIDCDVHEVRAHPFRPNIAIAAAAAGLCISRDGGMTWSVETDGLHAPYCSAVAFAENDILVAASTDHFASFGALYRRPVDGTHRLERVNGLPEWLDGIVDTGCLAARGSALAVADQGGNLYESVDAGRSWRKRGGGLPRASSVLVVR